MITLTKEFRRSLADDDRSYSASAVIILADQTRIELADDEIWSDGFAVEDAVSDDDNFTALGATVINAGTLIIDNTRDKYIGYDFMNADVTMFISKTFGEGTEQERTEVVKMGTFRVDDPNYDEATITLSMLDMMEQFDRPYELSSLQYPATLAEIVRDACAICLGSSSKLATQTFPHSDYVVQEAPKDRACTFREVIGWAATIAGCFARCNRDGELEIKWFNTAAIENASGTDGGQFDSGTPAYTTGDSLDGGTFSPWSTGSEADGGLFTDNIPLHYVGRLYSQKIAVDETVITKVAITVEDDSADAEQKTLTFETGTAGYTIQIAGNKFITKTTAQAVCNWLGQQMIGLRFRKCNVTQADDPSIEAGDVGLLFDSRQNEYPILITRMAFEIGGPQTIVCGSETPSRNSATRFTQATKSFVESRKLLKQQKNAYEQALEDLADDIEHNAHGLYAEEIADPNDPNATIYCLHDKPLLEDSDVRIHVSTIGIAVTKNGTAQQPTWYALRVDGTLIASILNTIGLNFSWGVGGELRIMKGNTETLYVNADTGVVRINCDSFSLSNGDTIASIAGSQANSVLSTFISGTYSPDKLSLQNQIDGKADTWYQGSDPALDQNDPWNTNDIKAKHVGDLWYNTTNGTTWYYNYDGSTYGWVQQNVPDAVFDKIDGKSQIFTSQPTPPYAVGDLWFSSTTSDIKVCTNARSTGSYTASDWEKRDKYTDDSAVTTLNNSLDQEEIFNRLTNNGQTQGIYLQDGKLYLNFSYAKGGTLVLGGSNNGRGRLEVLDAADNLIGTWDNTGAVFNSYNSKVYIGNCSYPQYNNTEGDVTMVNSRGFKISRILNGNEVSSKSFIDGGQIESDIEYNSYKRRYVMLRQIEGAAKGTVYEEFYDLDDYAFVTHPFGGYSNDAGISVHIGHQTGGQDWIHFETNNCMIESRRIHFASSNTDEDRVSFKAYSFQVVFSKSSTSSTPSASVGSKNLAFESSSSRRYKHDIKYGLTGDRDFHRLLKLKVAEFVFNDGLALQFADMKGKTLPGLIAEDVAEIYPSAAIHNNDTGEVESWDERRIIPGMLALIQEQQKTLEEQQEQLNRQQLQISEMQAQIKELKELVQKAQDKADKAFRLAWI